MGKSKKKRQDFQKVKLKVGRKLKKGQNVTNTSFKSRTVQVTQQLKTGEITEPNTRKKQNIGELLSHCRHYNTSVRSDAVAGLRELVVNFPDIVEQNLAAILEKSSELLIDKDATVRQGAIRLLKTFLSKVSEKQISPFFPLLCAHLCCAMTHIYDEIQMDSLSVLDILLETFPKLMVTKSSQVLTNFMDQISRKQGQVSGSRSLSVNPNSKVSSLKWRTSVLCRLEKFLVAILDNNKKKHGGDDRSPDEKDDEFLWLSAKSAGADVYPQSFKQNWEVSGFTLSSSGDTSISDDQGSESIQGIVTTLVPLLIECWIESAPSKQLSSVEGSLLHSESVGMVSSILNVTQLLMECTGLYKDDDQDLSVNGKYMKDFQQHFLTSFPYSVHTVAGKKGDKSEKNEQISAENINLAICDIMTQLTVEPSLEIPAWFTRIVNYLKDLLQGKYDTKIVGQSSKTVVNILRRFMMLGVREDIIGDLLGCALKRYKEAHHLSAEKLVYLKFFSEVCLSYDRTCSASEAVRHEFLQSLPELLTLVTNSNHEMAAIVITTMKTVACQKCSDVLDLISSACPKWFDVDGKFLHLVSRLQRELFSLLYFLPSLPALMYKNLVLLTRQAGLSESEVEYLLQVLHNRYKLFSRDQDQCAAFIGFLCSLLLGELEGEVGEAFNSPSYRNLGGHYLDNFNILTENIARIPWSRHIYIAQHVCELLQAFDNQDQVVTVIESLLIDYVTRSALDLRRTFGICMFAKSSSCSTTFMSHIRNVSFSIVEDLNNDEKRKHYPELFSLGLELVLTIPGALKELLDLVWREMESSCTENDSNHQCFLNGSGLRHLRLCRVFLNEEIRAEVRRNPGCLDMLRKIVARHHYYTENLNKTQDSNEPTARQTLLAEIDYLVNN